MPTETVKPTKKTLTEQHELEGKRVISVLSLIGRISARLSEHPALQSARIGIAEWLVLQEISRQPEHARASQIAKRLDVTPQRINAVMKSLSELGYTTTERSEGDTRARDIKLTAGGRECVKAGNIAFLSLFESAFRDKPQLIAQLRASLQRVADQMPPPEAQKVR